MKLPTYNPDGKKLTFQQHMKLMREMEEREKSIVEENDGEKPGRCPKCDNTGFTLLVKNGILYRTCKICGDKKEF